jgi:hypothetical protein
MNRWPDKLALLVITFWVGSLWAIGALAAPTLFKVIPTSYLAGLVAGKMFTLVAYVGMASGAYLLAYYISRFGAGAFRQAVFWVVAAMLLITLLGHFGIQPIMAEIRAQAAVPADVMQGMFANRFRTWHGIASIAYLLECVLGVVLVLRAR